MYWGPNVTIFRCRINCQAWAERAKMNATSCAWLASWVRGVDYCGPPSGPMWVFGHFHPSIMPLEFIISSLFRVCALSANCLGPITLVHWNVRRGRHGLPNHHYACNRDCGPHFLTNYTFTCGCDCGLQPRLRLEPRLRGSLPLVLMPGVSQPEELHWSSSSSPSDCRWPRDRARSLLPSTLPGFPQPIRGYSQCQY